jgi:TolA-binding protein
MDQPGAKQLYEQALEAGRLRDYPRAAALLQELLVRTDGFPDALLLLGRSFHALGDYARAAQVLQLYLNANPDSAPGAPTWPSGCRRSPRAT